MLVYLGDEALEGGETVFWLPSSDGGQRGGKGAPKGKAGGKRARRGGRTGGGTGADGDEALDVPVDGMEELAVAPRPGMLLLHRHGDACLLHEGRRVTAGAKYVLRTDLVFSPPS